MLTNKLRPPGYVNVPRKTSPATPRTGRKLRTPGSDSDSLSSPSHPVISRKKKPTKVSELESQLARLQDELKKAKDQLTSSESWKKKAQQETDEAKSQLSAILAELEKTQKQLNELSYFDDARIQELRKISQDRDKAWQYELEAVQKQHRMDSAALASALNEIQRLRIQLNKISESEASQARHAESAHAEIRSLRVELMETLELVGKLKSQLSDSRESEALALEEVGRAQVLLEVVKNTEQTFKLENGYVMESYKSLLVELESSKSKVNSLEGLVSKFQADFANASKISAYSSDVVKAENGECDRSENLKNEASRRLRDALEEDVEKRYRDQYLEMIVQTKDANKLANQREAELEAKLKESSTKLIEKDNILQNELKKSESVLEDLKASLLEKEMRVQSIMEENETLKSEILKKEIEKSEKSLEMEAELRRLKVQSHQWRKAAEAAMLLTGNNGKYVEKMGNLDYQTIGGKLGSPFSDDELAVKKNGSVLMKIGVLLKKGKK